MSPLSTPTSHAVNAPLGETNNKLCPGCCACARMPHAVHLPILCPHAVCLPILCPHPVQCGLLTSHPPCAVWSHTRGISSAQRQSVMYQQEAPAGSGARTPLPGTSLEKLSNLRKCMMQRSNEQPHPAPVGTESVGSLVRKGLGRAEESHADSVQRSALSLRMQLHTLTRGGQAPAANFY